MGSTFDPLARRSGALPGTIEREWLVWALRDEVRRGRIAYDSTEPPLRPDGGLPDDVKQALRDLGF
jgi:hypothetical protein